MSNSFSAISSPSINRDLEHWMEYIQTLHNRTMDLTLDRVQTVVSRFGYAEPPFKVISVAGTNGKGSVATTIDSILREAGYVTGLYTSPHLVNINERFVVNGKPISDSELLEEFEIVEAIRGRTPLTFFEFGTAIAIDYFYRKNVDVAVMEVGLGGRLDAVNIFDADIACITSIGTDHRKWLGSTRETIGFEKAGILRYRQLAVCTDPCPPESILKAARKLETQLHVNGLNFEHSSAESDWIWRMKCGKHNIQIENLPYSPLLGDFQQENCTGAVTVAVLAREFLEISDQAIRDGIISTSISGRLQIVQNNPEVLLDVAHNEEAVRALNSYLESAPVAGRNIAVMSALSEKPVESMIQVIRDKFDEWLFCGIQNSPRGISLDELASRAIPLLSRDTHYDTHSDANSAFECALQSATSDDRIVVFGSFFVVGDIIRRYQLSPI